jgi:hypothetical protein
LGVLDKALDFASRGLRVFPVHKKNPQLEKWPDLATTDEATIRAWYEGKYQYCDSFGVCPGRDAVVIDVDVKDGKKGKESLKWLKQAGLPMETFAVRTRSGGLHLYFKFPPVPENLYVKSIAAWEYNGKKLDGIDIRGTRGFVVGPTDDNGYSILQNREIVDLPGNVQAALPIGNVVKEVVNTQSANQLVSEEASALRGNIPEVIRRGERHNTLISLMASWARKVSYDNAVLLLEIAISRCEDQETDPIDIQKYIPRLDEAYKKFEPVIKEKLDWMLDNLVFIESGPRIYNISKPGNIGTMNMPEARGFFANWILWEETNGGGTKPVSVFDRWIKHTARKSSPQVGYKPVKDMYYKCAATHVDVINSYRGPEFQIVQTETDVAPFIDFVNFLLQDDSEVFLDWCAHLIQQPEKKMAWAPVIVSTKEGLGKNFMFNIISNLIGPWNTKNISAGLFIKTFNTFLVNSILVLINELEEVDAKKRFEIVSKLKGYITESQQTIEPKGINAYPAEIFTNFALFSNKEDAVHISDDSRRFFVHINYEKPRDQAYYAGLSKWLIDGGGYQAVYNFLATRNIAEFAWYGHAPATESKSIMVNAGLSTEEGILKDAIENHVSIFKSDIVTRDSLLYFLVNKLPKGLNVHSSRIKYILRENFESLPLLDGIRKGRQVRVPTIDLRSDEDMVIPGDMDKQVIYTCRNHDKWARASIDAIMNEYQKVFNIEPKTSALKVVK